jgi:hypothetical protein
MLKAATTNTGRSQKLRLFQILRENLIATRSEYASREIILCPLCLRPLTIEDIKSVEHIIPRNVLKTDPSYMQGVSLSRRAGLTALCRTPRSLIGGKTVPQGCNGWKGQVYDRLFKSMLQGQLVQPSSVNHRHGVAILTMAYLAAFQQFGYGYILNKDFDGIRAQFDFPDKRITPWLDHARMRLPQHDPNYTVWATASGLPFAFGSVLTPTASLDVLFRRFHAVLPSGHWKVTNTPAILLPAMLEELQSPDP